MTRAQKALENVSTQLNTVLPSFIIVAYVCEAMLTTPFFTSCLGIATLFNQVDM